MNKYLLSLVIFFIPLIIFAQSEQIKVKVVENNTTVKVKIQLDKRKIEENNYRAPKYYYTNLTARTNDAIVFNISMGPTISNNGIFRFKFENTMRAKVIQFYTTDNRGKQKTVSVPIVPAEKVNKNNTKFFKILKPVTYTIENDYRESNADVWKAKTADKAIERLYDSLHFIENKIQIFTPKLNQKYESTPVSIKSDIKLESIAVMIDEHESPIIAIYSLLPNDIIDFHLRIVLPTHPKVMNLIVVGKGLDGKLYRSTQKVELSLSGDSCGS